MAEAGGTQRKETKRLHEGEDAAIPQAERGGALCIDDSGLGQGIEVVVADQAVVAQIFNAQEASVGGKADLPQGGEIAQSPTDLEVIRVVDGRFRAERLAFFVVLLDAGLLVVDVERGYHAFRQDAGARSEEHTSELQSRLHLVCRLLLEKKKANLRAHSIT